MRKIAKFSFLSLTSLISSASHSLNEDLSFTHNMSRYISSIKIIIINLVFQFSTADCDFDESEPRVTIDMFLSPRAVSASEASRISPARWQWTKDSLCSPQLLFSVDHHPRVITIKVSRDGWKSSSSLNLWQQTTVGDERALAGSWSCRWVAHKSWWECTQLNLLIAQFLLSSLSPLLIHPLNPISDDERRDKNQREFVERGRLRFSFAPRVLTGDRSRPIRFFLSWSTLIAYN